MKIEVGDRVKFQGEARPYKVFAADDRFAVCMKPFNLKKVNLYTIIDQERGVRGPDNRVFCEGYTCQEDALRALGQLQQGAISVSSRRCVELDIEKVNGFDAVLGEEHLKCLHVLSEWTHPHGEMCRPFSLVSEETGFDRKTVRRCVRTLAHMGLAQYYRALVNEDGMFAGAGYCITKAGLEMLEKENSNGQK